MDFKFRTISVNSTSNYKAKGSRFESFAYPVENTSQIKQHLNELKKLHHKARHHCFAYVLGSESSQFRSSDDGEPKHSAGDPILGQIRSHDLTNVLIVVVRYFGGTKLGISGLIKAYREAARGAIEASQIITSEINQSILLTFTYQEINEVMRIQKELNLSIEKQVLEQVCQMKLLVPRSKMEIVKGRLKQVPEVTFEIKN